jgi:prevent-host-death family protein
MTVKEAEATLTRTVRRVRDERERFTLTENGKPVAAIVTAEDLAFLEDLEERIDLEEARKALAELGESIPWEKVKAELGL